MEAVSMPEINDHGEDQQYSPPDILNSDDFEQTQTQTQTQPLTQTDLTPPDTRMWAVLKPVEPASGLSRQELLNDKLEYVIGRDRHCDIRVQHKKVSGFHCRIWHEEDSRDVVQIEDLSSNGTYVNGRKLGRNQKSVLCKNDEISLGAPNENPGEDLRFDFYPVFHQDPTMDGGLHVHYVVGSSLGEGNFAIVNRAIDRKTGVARAVKTINKRKFAHDPKTLAMLEKEREILRSISHQYIASYIDYFEDSSHIFIILELADGGDLFSYIINNDGLSSIQASMLTKMLCEAIAYLHENNIVHRDLKPENILLTKGSNPIVKVTDFGLAKVLTDQTMLRTMCGTIAYLAPEVILQTGDGYSPIVDAWSIGAIVFACLANSHAFVEDSQEPLEERMMKRKPYVAALHERNAHVSAIDFILKLLRNDPKTRMTVAEALSHPFLALTEEETWSENDSLPYNSGEMNKFKQSTATSMAEVATTDPNLSELSDGDLAAGSDVSKSSKSWLNEFGGMRLFNQPREAGSNGNGMDGEINDTVDTPSKPMRKLNLNEYSSSDVMSTISIAAPKMNGKSMRAITNKNDMNDMNNSLKRKEPESKFSSSSLSDINSNSSLSSLSTPSLSQENSSRLEMMPEFTEKDHNADSNRNSSDVEGSNSTTVIKVTENGKRSTRTPPPSKQSRIENQVNLRRSARKVDSPYASDSPKRSPPHPSMAESHRTSPRHPRSSAGVKSQLAQSILRKSARLNK